MRCRFTALFAVLLCVPAVAGPARSPDLALKDTAGHKQRLSAYRGNIVVLSFWATWCLPCQEELPRLSQLSQSYAGKPVKFIAVSIDESKKAEALAAFLAQRGVQLETWMGGTPETMAAFGLGEIVPATIVLDAEGVPITRINGEAREEDVRSPVDWLLAGRAGAAPPATLKRY